MVIISKHTRRQMEKRGITEEEVIETLKNCNVIFEEKNDRIGLKRYSKLPFKLKSLIVIWFVNRSEEEEIVTAYWRRNKK